MDTSLQDLCREARLRANLTAQDIADASGVSFSSVNNFFASASKAPSVYTVGPVCRVLGVSLDRFFDITEVLSPEQQMVRMQRLHTTELHAARMEGEMESMRRHIKAQQTLIIIMSVVLSIILLLLALYVILDYRAPNVGLIQGGHTSVIAWVMFLLLAVGIGVIAAVLLSALHYARRHAQLRRE
nr:MAG TPA: structural protein [Caudoviricetes sp.]